MRLVHAIHDFLPRHRAGSELYALALCRELARRHLVTIVCAEYDPGRVHGTVTWRVYEGLPVAEIVNNWRAEQFSDSYRPTAINQALEHILRATGPDVLHVHNLLNLSFDLPAIARARGIPSVATLHDYTLVCPSGGQRVHMAEQHICEDIEADRCARCFPQSPFFSQMAAARIPTAITRSPRVLKLADVVRRRLPTTFKSIEGQIQPRPERTVTSGDIRERLARVGDVFDAIDRFVAPSAALGAEYVRFGLPCEKLRISDYGFQAIARPAKRKSARLRLGFVGTLVWHKGVHVLIDAMKRLPADRVELHIFGDVNVFPDYVQSLKQQSKGLRVEFKGGFSNVDAESVYAEFDVLVVPSLWPENSPLVIHEAFMSGVPVIGSRQGGIPGLVTDGVNGLLYDAFSGEHLAHAVQRLIDDRSLIDRFEANLPAVKSIEQDAEEWDALYAEVVSEVGRPEGRPLPA